MTIPSPATPAFASASDTREQRPRITQLAKGVYGYISDFDPNCGFIVGNESVVLVDTRPTPRMARDFLLDIRSVTDKPVKYIVLTHYHAVRVMGASAFGPDATIIASRGTHDWIVTRGQADFESEVDRFPRLFQGVEEIPGLVLPDISFTKELTLWLDEREIRLSCLGRGHSQGDTVAYLPDCGVMFSGDLVENRCGVYAGDAYLHDWSQTLHAVDAMAPTTLVPGRGAVLQGLDACREATASTRSFIEALLSNVSAGIEAGEDLRACYVRTDTAMRPIFGEWPLYQHVLPFGVSRAWDELHGVEHPIVWTAERDQTLWQILLDAPKAPAATSVT
ncbi:MBL fold metallo-hydrolase [Pusillimonas sp.]|uniref:MBL fold metallo-hydrolase n=1 Tax=Pusillimonas sp. TaxID=3040095 RepID=UPI0037CBC922